MSEFEYIQAIELLNSAGREYAILLFSVLFAYCLTAYFIGKELPRFAAISLSILYSYYILVIIVGMVGVGVQYRAMVESYIESYSSHTLWVDVTSMTVTWLVVVPYVVAWLGSLVFMHC